MKCKDCMFCSVSYRARSNGNNRGARPRHGFSCVHKMAVETHKKMYPRTSRTYGFIGFSELGKNFPSIKNHPRWCPIEQEAQHESD